LRRSSRPPLDRVDPVILPNPSNAKSPDAMPGEVDIAFVSVNVSSRSRRKFATPTPSFRDGPQDQTRNLEIPGSMLRIAPE